MPVPVQSEMYTYQYFLSLFNLLQQDISLELC